ncbi:succinate dehydrogenase hydrophobic membrane anchor [Candidatus Liberibacter solanacearum CLso-ZC1]|uniref:Succinate dehydrogenase hydrophobic membrane anchor subunit n=1 Tax=Liberibacter solanacearum (strain CLso-ZC1) TaxID=658172 RepID=E4UAZ1_LIBSC|nr:succinate dehydrogenase, hydrophobic membrane anchor protein [Candidatus Liberibacter solanacearum]ADR52382.1 succinate dehydrogenase hydrophobic membrane anchor [Candidatus Liberibacter solanacearum CLso-ZC1]
MNMRSSLGKVRGMGSAKDGTGHFLKQRFTAIANIPFVIFFIIFFIRYGSAPHEQIVSVVSNLFVASIMGLGAVSIFFHMQLGMQVIIEDYVHSKLLKIVLLMLNSSFVLFMAVFCLFSILKISILGNQ